MTEDEAIQVSEYVAAACPAQKFGEFTPDVWGEILAPYTVDDARRAVIAVAARQPFISPAEIITEIKARREERIELASVVYEGNPLETGEESATARRALIRAAADGQLPPRPVRAALDKTSVPELPPGRAAAVLAAVGKTVPRVREGVVNPRAIPCRHCQALPGTSCTTRGRRMKDPHPARLDDARRAAAGLPPIDPADELRAQERIRAASAALAEQPTTEPTEETA